MSKAYGFFYRDKFDDCFLYKDECEHHAIQMHLSTSKVWSWFVFTDVEDLSNLHIDYNSLHFIRKFFKSMLKLTLIERI